MFADADRPRAPKHPDAEITPRGRHGQLLLKGIHDHLRHEMAEVVGIVDRVAAGELEAAVARAQIDRTTMMRNFRWVASFCAQYCRRVEVHHTIEDRRTFVDLGTADPSLQPVLDRLAQEHEVIHAVLVDLAALLEDLADGAGAARVAARVRELSAGLLSHLDYEEAELLEPIGRLSIDV